MELVISIAVVIALLLTVNLLFTYGLARKVSSMSRNHSMASDALEGSGDVEGVLSAGSLVEEFSAMGTQGEKVTSESITEELYIGFFSPGCQPCHEQLPDYLEVGARDGAPLLAVLVGRKGNWEEMCADAATVGAVVLEELGGKASLTSIFDVTAFPRFCHVRREGHQLRVVATSRTTAIFKAKGLTVL